MTGPVRIQRKRKQGWRMPEGAVYVGRPTRWGNPFGAVAFLDLTTSIELYGMAARGIWNPRLVAHLSDAGVCHVYNVQARWRERLGGHPLDMIPSELGGADLACWCPLDQPCHADVLLRLASS